MAAGGDLKTFALSVRCGQSSGTRGSVPSRGDLTEETEGCAFRQSGGLLPVSPRGPAAGKITRDLTKLWAPAWCITDEGAVPWKRGRVGAWARDVHQQWEKCTGHVN